jgi:hypothetical protein
MKRLLLSLAVLLTFAVNGYSQSPFVKVTATQRAGYSIDTTDFWLNPAKIQYVKKGTNPLVGYSDAPKSDTLIIYKVTQNFDTVVNQSNKAFANLVKLNNITYVTGTTRDTAIIWAYNFGHFVEMKSKSYSPMPKVHATISADYKNKAGYIRYDIGETPSVVKLRIDSLVRVARDSAY